MRWCVIHNFGSYVCAVNKYCIGKRGAHREKKLAKIHLYIFRLIRNLLVYTILFIYLSILLYNFCILSTFKTIINSFFLQMNGIVFHRSVHHGQLRSDSIKLADMQTDSQG